MEGKLKREAEVIAVRVRDLFDYDIAPLSDSYFYSSLPLCVIDAVYSIGVRYQGVQNVISNYCDYFELEKYRKSRRGFPSKQKQQKFISDLIASMEREGVDTYVESVFRNRQRTSPRNGILKAEAVLRFARVLLSHGVNYFQDIPDAMKDSVLTTEIMAIPGQGSGISLQYFFMLAGSDDLIKPDRMIMRFLERALNRPVIAQECQPLLAAAVAILKKEAAYREMTPRWLDNLIWQFQRRQ